MDLAAGAKRLWVIMDHTTKSGGKKLVKKCTYPLTALGAVKDAQRSGNFAQYGAALQRLDDAMNKYEAAK